MNRAVLHAHAHAGRRRCRCFDSAGRTRVPPMPRASTGENRFRVHVTAAVGRTARDAAGGEDELATGTRTI
jgi:hypothetical protein